MIGIVVNAAIVLISLGAMRYYSDKKRKMEKGHYGSAGLVFSMTCVDWRRHLGKRRGKDKGKGKGKEKERAVVVVAGRQEEREGKTGREAR